MHTALSISIETVDFDPVTCILHLKGRNVAENEHVKMGQYHTLDIDVGKKFKLWKPYWDSIDLNRLDLALDVGFTISPSEARSMKIMFEPCSSVFHTIRKFYTILHEFLMIL